MKRCSIILLAIMLLPISWAYSQTLELDYCQERARSLSPIKKQELLYESQANLNIKNLNTLNLPQSRLNGTYNYLSDVLDIGIDIAGLDIAEIPQNQYTLTLDISQKIYDGGYVKNAKKMQEAQLAANVKGMEVDLFEIKGMINTLYFNALVYQENEKLLGTVVDELNGQLKKIMSAVENGAMLKTNANILNQQILKIQQQILEVQLGRKAVIDMLSDWIGEPISPDAEFALPLIADQDLSQDISRPEQQYFDLMEENLESQKKVLNAQVLPSLSGIAQLGVGSPNPLNYFETDATEYYVVGASLKWNFWDWKQTSRKKKVLEINKEILSSKKEDFEKKINIASIRDKSSIDTYNQLIEKDKKILELQEDIVRKSYSQFQNGVITSTEYIIEVNKRTEAQLNLQIHGIQKIQSEINYLTTKGNL
ncbi:TolC family protein [Zobellia nedashkovskayae]|uniref:TolC family protein n=1 Tax=Zobellia nedashkovskayae TaxID=2779510 RepID=UPI00188A780C|nr:TolC family protein [Zobellia nedashkovskayae]